MQTVGLRHFSLVGSPRCPSRAGPPFQGSTFGGKIDNLAVRFTAVLDDEVVGYLNVRDDLTRGGTVSRLSGWAELREHFVEPEYRRQGVATWLLCHAIDWVRLGGCERLLAHWSEDLGPGSLTFLGRFGWLEIGRTRVGWRRSPAPLVG